MRRELEEVYSIDLKDMKVGQKGLLYEDSVVAGKGSEAGRFFVGANKWLRTRSDARPERPGLPALRLVTVERTSAGFFIRNDDKDHRYAKITVSPERRVAANWIEVKLRR